jgi:DnaA-homolog protein
MRQLPLGVHLQERARLQNFLVGGNPQVMAQLTQFLQAGAPSMLWLAGPRGAGKSHLLQALCAERPGSAYLPLDQLAPLGEAVLQGAPSLSLLAIDEVQSIAGQRQWERALLVLHNDCLALGVPVIYAAPVLPAHAGVQLPDLASRWQGLLQLALLPLSEEDQRAVLRKRALHLGLDLPEECLRYLAQHFARDLGTQVALLEKLDQASMAEQRRLTLPFVRKILGP